MARPHTFALAAIAALGSADATASGETGSPIAKVIEMLGGLETKIIHEGETAHKEYAAYAEWCEDTSKDLHYEIRTGEGEVADLKATIEKESATQDNLNAKIEELSATAARAEEDLAAATKIRGEEHADFVEEEKELMSTLSALSRATKILSEEMAKGGAAMVQFSQASNVVQALSAMVEASMINSADGDRLTALVQSSAKTGDEDDESGAPAGAVYSNQSGGIVEVLEGLSDKAEDQLAKARDAETKGKHNYEVLKQSLVDESSTASFELGEAKTNMAASREAKEVAEGDLDVTSKDLAEDKRALAETHKVCMKTAEDYEQGTRSRDEELAALASAKKVIRETSGGADSLSYSFMQVSSTQGQPRAVERFIVELAKKRNSQALAQLAQRISSTIRIKSSRGQDPFGKVKSLISDMIKKLEDAAGADATEKAYCDKEIRESTEKSDDKAAEIKKLDTAIDEATSRIAVLEEETSQLTKDLAAIAKSQAGYDEWFAEKEATYNSNKADMEAGIKGVQLALKVLKEYYAKNDTSGSGAASGIIGLLETCESDFSKGLAEMTSEFENQKVAHQQTTKENEVTVTTKSQDLKYKNIEITNKKKFLGETQGERNGVQAELDPVTQYLAKLAERCTEKAEPYEVIKARRDAEIAGLKEGLQVLESEAALVQVGRSTKRAKFLRH